MVFVLGFLLGLALMWAGYTTYRIRVEQRIAQESERSAAELKRSNEQLQQALRSERQRLNFELERVGPWLQVADAKDRAKAILLDAEIARRQTEESSSQIMAGARLNADALVKEARADVARMRIEAENNIKESLERAAEIVADAEAKAKSIAGQAYEIKQNVEIYERALRAVRNRLEGYGDEYIVPAESLLDQLADEFQHKEAGEKLKQARSHTKLLIREGRASDCEYVEQNRADAAKKFVLDAFNGRVDSILSRVKHDNSGKLAEEIKDAYSLVNFGGKAFRDARVTEEYLRSRLDELRWAAVAQELRRIEQEEQRLIREQMREEERARREYERAVKQAAKEEQMLRNAMVKAQGLVANATAEQKAMYEAQLADLNLRLREAEERGQRAISMAQQTKKGHVYIVSNIGSFGEDVFKIGLTRRLEPLDRIRELGDASVPFEFDVHAMILSDDAPKLEYDLHRHFVIQQINKVNHRKEFFRASLGQIRGEIEKLGIEAKWTMAAEAKTYRETLAIEKAIANDPKARESWIQRQLELDPTAFEDTAQTAAEDDEEDEI